jgi:hypothetical protein
MALSPQEEKDFKGGSRVSAAGSRVTRVCGAFRDDLPGFSARSTLTKLDVVEHLEDPLESSKAAAIRAEAAIFQLRRWFKARFVATKLPLACRMKAGKPIENVACLLGFCGFVSYVTDRERKKGDPQVALFVVPVARLLCR